MAIYTNKLIHEKSPYLLQHAHNPVNWYPWGDEAFEKARRENKPIFLSIGYSTCHWCHVMERESFENTETARFLNQHFVSIKVDREERPDVDRVYMAFVQAATGGGGWPLSVWLTPDLKPFYGGTYYPAVDSYGRPGFPTVLKRLAEAWSTERERIIESSAKTLEQLRARTEQPATSQVTLDAGDVENGYYSLRRTYDPKNGGFGRAPKFPRPVSHNFLVRYYAGFSQQDALDMVLETLRKMAAGGIHDHLGGGFHRYSVDERWFVPHFEKMLYDQAQLAISCLEVYQITRDEFFAALARDIFEYVLRDMTAPDGGFYSAEDADSVIDPAKPGEKGEGAFYIWSWDQIHELLGKQAAEVFNYRYGVKKEGNVASDPQGEFTGRNILSEVHTVEEVAKHFGQTGKHVSAILQGARSRLLKARAKRVRPSRDDKVLTAWNALMISAFALGSRILPEPRYAKAARRAADLILSRMYEARSGILRRRYRDGDTAVEGVLEDYSFFTVSLIDLYETTFEWKYLAAAGRLGQKMIELFEDRDQGGFFTTPTANANLVLRLKDDYDGAEPAGNSMAAWGLLRLAQMTGREEFRTAAGKAIKAFSHVLRSAPAGSPQLLLAFDFARSSPKQIVIAGERGEDSVARLASETWRHFLAHRVILLADQALRERLAKPLPAIAGMKPVKGRPAAYVCENYTCQLPVTDTGKLAELLQ